MGTALVNGRLVGDYWADGGQRFTDGSGCCEGSWGITRRTADGESLRGRVGAKGRGGLRGGRRAADTDGVEMVVVTKCVLSNVCDEGFCI